jgi:hypothetical protein
MNIKCKLLAMAGGFDQRRRASEKIVLSGARARLVIP